MKLNLGCGAQVVAGWTNVDDAFGARLFKLPLFRQLNKKLKLFRLEWHKNVVIHNLTKPFPWNDDSVDTIYSSHTLEHFTRDEGRFFLNECYRILCRGGIIRIIVPDLNFIVERYTNGVLKADRFIEELGVHYSSQNDSVKTKLARLTYFPHKCMYDTQTLMEIMSEIGFTAEKRKAFDSDITGIEIIELEDRTNNSIIVEGKKG